VVVGTGTGDEDRVEVLLLGGVDVLLVDPVFVLVARRLLSSALGSISGIFFYKPPRLWSVVIPKNKRYPMISPSVFEFLGCFMCSVAG
jgi:hypothetical protein